MIKFYKSSDSIDFIEITPSQAVTRLCEEDSIGRISLVSVDATQDYDAIRSIFRKRIGSALNRVLYCNRDHTSEFGTRIFDREYHMQNLTYCFDCSVQTVTYKKVSSILVSVSIRRYPLQNCKREYQEDNIMEDLCVSGKQYLDDLSSPKLDHHMAELLREVSRVLFRQEEPPYRFGVHIGAIRCIPLKNRTYRLDTKRAVGSSRVISGLARIEEYFSEVYS